jgi:Icc-related predicted phosphoesterase
VTGQAAPAQLPSDDVDGLKLAFIGDTHGRVIHALAAIMEAQRQLGVRFDWVFQVGDFGAFPNPGEIRWIGVDAVEPSAREFLNLLRTPAPDQSLQRIRDQLSRPVVFLRGNHDSADWLRALPREGALAAADPHDLFQYAPDGSVLNLGAMTVAFLGGIEKPGPASFPHPGSELIDDLAFETLWALGPGRVDILITHEPPAGACTFAEGSSRITELVRRLRPAVHVGGHLHVPVGPVAVAGTTYLGLSSLLRSPARDPARALQPGSIAVMDTGHAEAVHLDAPWLREIRADTLSRWLP